MFTVAVVVAMTEADIEFLKAVAKRYSKALDAKPSKGPVTDFDALTDSVCDIPDLLAMINQQERKLNAYRNKE